MTITATLHLCALGRSGWPRWTRPTASHRLPVPDIATCPAIPSPRDTQERGTCYPEAPSPSPAREVRHGVRMARFQAPDAPGRSRGTVGFCRARSHVVMYPGSQRIVVVRVHGVRVTWFHAGDCHGGAGPARDRGKLTSRHHVQSSSRGPRNASRLSGCPPDTMPPPGTWSAGNPRRYGDFVARRPGTLSGAGSRGPASFFQGVAVGPVPDPSLVDRRNLTRGGPHLGLSVPTAMGVRR